MGPWHSLLSLALETYCVRDHRRLDNQRFEEALAGATGAFWCRSFEVAPEETASEVRSALIRLLEATDPRRGLDPARLSQLGSRLRGLVGDLAGLVTTAGGSLPGDLGAIQGLLRASPLNALRPILVYAEPAIAHGSQWQRALIEKLNRDARRAHWSHDPELSSILKDALGGHASGKDGSALGRLQQHLFAPAGPSAAMDASVQCIRVRDFYQEAETAAGMAQSLLDTQPGLQPAEIGILVPDDFGYHVAVEDAFRLAGLSLSGLPGERWRRDLGAEAVLHFLSCQQKPAPAMALAACLSSPLMPWSAGEGGTMAQQVMDGHYDLRAPGSGGAAASAMLQLVLQGCSEPAEVRTALGGFLPLLSCGDALSHHLTRAGEAAARAMETLEGSEEIDWVELRRAAGPRYIANGEPVAYTLEGVTVLRERHEAWRNVRHLLVMGFSAGRFPRRPQLSSVFTADDIRSIRARLDIPVDSAGAELERHRQLFRRQLCAASESVTLLLPRRSEKGEALAPSESLVFIERLFWGTREGETLINEPDSPADRARIRHLPLAAPSRAVAPRSLQCTSLALDRDLIGLRRDRSGNPRPESPSSLETLLVSPLAWLLRRVGAEPVNWAPETAGPSVLGSLVHGAFERIFRPDAALPERASLESRTSATLDDVALQQAPFFRNPKWRVERMHLSEQAGRAAATWGGALEVLGAEVLASEVWLQGNWSGIGIHGQADLILGLEGDRLLVVDYKWSQSGPRRKRMENQLDSQAYLYRAMLESGGPKRQRGRAARPGSGHLASRLRSASEIGIVYYMMRDRIFLADLALPDRASLRGWDAVGGDVARLATSRIREVLAEVRTGVVRLNGETDRKSLLDAGLSTYALDTSPLIDLFMLPGGDS